MLQERDDIVALDSAILQHPRVWEASGHLAGFTDPLVDCTHVQGSASAPTTSTSCSARKKPSKHPGEFEECDLTEARDFNLMFETTVGPVKESGSAAYLRPETAQGIFINFKNVLQFSRKKPPFGIAQIGKSFRNEITPGNFIFRTREFEQMEMEFFVPPAEGAAVVRPLEGRAPPLVRGPGHPPRPPAPARARPRRAQPLLVAAPPTSSTSSRSAGRELEGIANRTDFDLKAHAEHSGQTLEYFDGQTEASATSRT